MAHDSPQLPLVRLDLGPDLAIRPYAAHDLEPMVEIANDAQVSAGLGATFPHPYTRGSADAFYLILQAQNPVTCFVIVNGDDLILGGVGVVMGRSDSLAAGSAELGYWLGRRYWGQGFGTRAASAMADWAFETLGLRRLGARVFTDNPASDRVLLKLGFTREGVTRESAMKNGTLYDEAFYGLLRREWADRKGLNSQP